jgi:hypothetical protein
MAVDTALCDCDRCVPAPAEDLIETLGVAASDAIRDQAPALVGGGGSLRSVNIELELSNVGAVVDSPCWIERRGVHRRG